MLLCISLLESVYVQGLLLRHLTWTYHDNSYFWLSNDPKCLRALLFPFHIFWFYHQARHHISEALPFLMLLWLRSKPRIFHPQLRLLHCLICFVNRVPHILFLDFLPFESGPIIQQRLYVVLLPLTSTLTQECPYEPRFLFHALPLTSQVSICDFLTHKLCQLQHLQCP